MGCNGLQFSHLWMRPPRLRVGVGPGKDRRINKRGTVPIFVRRKWDCPYEVANRRAAWFEKSEPASKGRLEDRNHDSVERKRLLQLGGKGNAAAVAQAVFEVIARPRWADYFVGMTFPWGFYSPDEYGRWLREAGFVALRLELIPKDMTQEGRKGLEGWLRTTWMPYGSEFPPICSSSFSTRLSKGT